MLNSHLLFSRMASYHRPAIIQKGRLTQFAGSPMGKKLDNPLDLPRR